MENLLEFHANRLPIYSLMVWKCCVHTSVLYYGDHYNTRRSYWSAIVSDLILSQSYWISPFVQCLCPQMDPLSWPVLCVHSSLSALTSMASTRELYLTYFGYPLIFFCPNPRFTGLCCVHQPLCLCCCALYQCTTGCWKWSVETLLNVKRTLHIIILFSLIAYFLSGQ